MTAKKKVMLLPGDGIGQEVMAQVVRVVEWMDAAGLASFDLTTGLIGGASIDAYGVPLTDETVADCLACDAVLMGAVGGPKWDGVPFDKKPERGLLRIRKDMGLFANLRPAIVFPELAAASTLKPEVVAGLDILIVRELIGGIYFGQPRGIETLPNGDRKGFNTLVYTTPEIRRIGRVAFDLAMKRGRKVTSVDKANVLESTVLWREEMEVVAKDYPEVALSHLYVDNASMQLVRNPQAVRRDGHHQHVRATSFPTARRCSPAPWACCPRPPSARRMRRPASATRFTSRCTAPRPTSRARTSPIRWRCSCRWR